MATVIFFRHTCYVFLDLMYFYELKPIMKSIIYDRQAIYKLSLNITQILNISQETTGQRTYSHIVIVLLWSRDQRCSSGSCFHEHFDASHVHYRNSIFSQQILATVELHDNLHTFQRNLRHLLDLELPLSGDFHIDMHGLLRSICSDGNDHNEPIVLASRFDFVQSYATCSWNWVAFKWFWHRLSIERNFRFRCELHFLA